MCSVNSGLQRTARVLSDAARGVTPIRTRGGVSSREEAGFGVAVVDFTTDASQSSGEKSLHDAFLPFSDSEHGPLIE